MILGAGLAAGQRINFDPLDRTVIERRVLNVPKGNAERAARVRLLLAEAGCREPSLREQTVKRSKIPNIICTLPGQGTGAIVVGAHTDSTGGGEGIIDNWSGASMLANLFETLARSPRKHSIIFVGFTAEEDGLIGSQAFVKAMSAEERTGIRAAVVMDSLGLTPLKFWPNGSDAELWKSYARVALAMGLPIEGIGIDRVGTTDSASFKEKQIPVISLHSVSQETLDIINGPGDTAKALKLDDYWNAYRLLTGYLVYLDSALP
jgi:hypothetical protein